MHKGGLTCQCKTKTHTHTLILVSFAVCKCAVVCVSQKVFKYSFKQKGECCYVKYAV